MRNSILLVSLFALTTSFAQETPLSNSPGTLTASKISKELSLSPLQDTQLNTMRTQTKATLDTTRNQIQSLNNEIKAISKENTIDETKLNALIEKKKELLGSMMKQKAMLLHQIYGILSPEQKTKFDDFVKQKELMHQESEILS